VDTPEAAAGAALLASEARLRVLLGCTKGIVFEFDHEARYLAAWTHDEGLLARPRAELTGRTIIEVLGEREGRRFTDAVQRVHATGRPETIEYQLEVQGGRRWFVADVVASPGTGSERTVVYLVREVTAHKQLEHQLRHAQKMEAIGQLAGGIAHDFNNILTTILGYSELLVAGLPASSVPGRQAAQIHHAAERGSALVSQLLAYARKQVLIPEVLDPNAVISSLAHMLRRLLGEHVKLRLALDPEVGRVEIDRSGLEQVLMNLSVNARDAVSPGGVITLRSANVELDAVHGERELAVAPGSYVMIAVEDDGHGMDAVVRARIFEPFFTTKDVGKGTGLGLSMVHGIIEQSAGHIEVDSTPGEGACFRIYLPRVK
jgi:PAS domain S-box-containing protein